MPEPVARFDDLRAGTTLQFDTPQRVIEAFSPQEVLRALADVEMAVAAGNWAYGFVAYEAASGLDPRVPVRDPVPGLPLVWFGISDRPVENPAPLPPTVHRPARPADAPGATEAGEAGSATWRLDWDRQEHAEAVSRVHAAISEGDTYQVNLTTRLRSALGGDLTARYAELAGRQQAAYCAYLDLGRWAVLSTSPELFFRWDEDVLTAAPMKGTAARGATAEADAAARSALLASEKDRAENVMIVDLIRNDLARVSEVGSVSVSELLACEEYPTVWQLTSTVTSRVRAGTTLPDVFTAMFPCGSVTGAPKLSTMQLIAELEPTPRGVYCGAIGYLAPGPRRRACFNVAIRTVVVDRATDSAVYGVGGGVTWASTAAGEFEELLAKSRVLDRGRAADLQLLETFALVDGVPRHLESHVDRLERSAAHFAFRVDREAVYSAVRGLSGTALVRLRLFPDGDISVELRPLVGGPEPVRLAMDTVPIDPASPFIRHKTTRREHYAAARDRHGYADDVVLVNPDGKVTETTVANLAVRQGGRWYTPPVSDGCLPGVGRAIALEQGDVEERSLTVTDLQTADAISLISSARGWRRAELIRDPGD